ncbi:MAG: tryptophan-rich sensory protein [Calditrichia bacterium]
MNRTTLAVINAVVFAITIAVNYLSNALPINGLTAGDISDKWLVLFKPAGYVFSIWGIIYLGLLAFIIYQFIAGDRENNFISKIGSWFIVNGLANAAWLVAWHYEIYWLTILIMLVILVSLIQIYTRLNDASEISPAQRYAVLLPFSIYLAWICVATIANGTILLESLGWGGFGLADSLWLIVVLLAGLYIAWQFAMRGDVAFTLVFVWAFAGVAVQNGSMPEIAPICWAATAIAGGLSVLAFTR